LVGPPAARLAVVDLRALDQPRRAAQARAVAEAEARRGFDLEGGGLLRVCLLRLAEQEQLLLVTMHHIVSDGWSMGVIVGELRRLYEAYAEGRPSPMAELAIQYADYALWQRRWLTAELLDAQLAYWRGQREGAPAGRALPPARPRPAR